MKLQNKKTGEIVDVRMSYREGTAPIVVSETTCDENGQSQGWPYDSLAELNAEWEDAPEESKECWYLDSIGQPIRMVFGDDDFRQTLKVIGNRFETEEEAEKAAERLRAWTRLKDKGLKIHLQSLKGYSYLEANWGVLEGDYSDVRLLFGGEE